MATPYLQLRVDETPSTQDLARERLDSLPVVVTAGRQWEGRGRSGSEWANAPRALAVSLAANLGRENRPVSLMAGLAATRSLNGVELKWPNDVLHDDGKVGGILVEGSGERVVVGFGVNLWWPDPPTGIGALYDEDPGEDRHVQLGALWAAEMMALLEGSDWPASEYRAVCRTLGRDITWEPDGSGRAVDVSDDGSLVVEVRGEMRSIRSGAVRHVRG